MYLMVDINQIIREAPDNFVIKDALCKAHEVIEDHSRIVCLVSGGGRQRCGFGHDVPLWWQGEYGLRIY